MSLGTKNPLRMLAGNISGGPNTGEFLQVRGGTRKAGLWSGTVAAASQAGFNIVTAGGPSFNLWSGSPGRLNSILMHTNIQSGAGVVFYDGTAALTSGISVSGASIVGVLGTQYYPTAASGVFQPLTGINEPFRPDMPFFSGLWAFAPSGCPGFTASFTIEADPTTPV